MQLERDRGSEDALLGIDARGSVKESSKALIVYLARGGHEMTDTDHVGQATSMQRGSLGVPRGGVRSCRTDLHGIGVFALRV